MKKNLYNQIFSKKQNTIFYKKKKINIKKLKTLINNRSKRINKYKKGIISISTKNKLEFIINFYACNKINYPVFLSDNNSIKKNLSEKIDINYIFKNSKLVKINNKFKPKYACHIIIRSSGSSSIGKYVYLKNENISHICKEINKEMYDKNKTYNELIFAPLYHAFGFGRLHALMSSNNNITLTDTYSISNFYNLLSNYNSINAISLPSKILSTIFKINKSIIKRLFNKIKYLQVSTGYLEKFYRKKILEYNINLFLNYGMTEAMRSTFLNLKKHKNKIHTEGKILPGVNMKIKKTQSKKYGEILINGKNLAAGYSNKEEWNKKFVNNYFETGDIGYIDKDRFLIFKSKFSNKLNINGKTFYTEDIENIIKKFSNLEKLKIVQNQKKIYLVSEKKINEKKLYKIFKKNQINIIFDKILINQLPLTETGKIKFSNIKRLINEKK